MSLTQKVFLGLILGIITGLALNLSGFANEGSAADNFLISGLFSAVGTLFMNALKMLVVPLVLFSLIPGIVGIGDIKLLGRVGGKSFVLYIATTALAIATAIIFASLFNIGQGLSIELTEPFSGKSAPPILDVLTGIIPINPIAALANGDMLSIIFFAIIFGICLLNVAKESLDLIRVIEQLNTVMMKMVEIVMHFAPYAVFCLIAKAIAQLGFNLLIELAGYVLVLMFVLLFHGFISLSLILKGLSGLNPITFLTKAKTAQLFAFSTASSGATIPVTLRTCQNRLGIDRSIASFSVPFGATINMDGTAMMQGVATVFIANIYGIDLGLSGYLTVILMAVLASIGTAAVPGVGLVMLTLVFTQVGLPVEGIGLILGVDRLLDMVRTAVNVTGDMVVSSVVAKSEGKLNEQVFQDIDAGNVT